ncbi:hypothetical protein Ddc_17049 [Ditylenchus destructor]|nr:hypothetical protein Ddc_17049 [Ditylenchus destructor]
MRRSAQLANLENESQRKPKPKKRRLDERITNIATLDNDTIVELFKYLNYRGLAKNSLVSKRFHDLIQTNRHKLALLYVSYIGMCNHDNDPEIIKISDKELLPEDYNEWAICNNYSKQIPLESHGVKMQSTQNERNFYEIRADYKDHDDSTNVFYARVELTHENWPIFQHFVRLFTDPFIFIRFVQLIPRNEVLNLLAAAIDPDHDRLQCAELALISNNSNPHENTEKLVTWVKNYVRCKKVHINSHSESYIGEELLDLFATGAQCTSAITTKRYDLSKAVEDFVQKFLDLKSCDENQMVESIEGRFKFMYSLLSEEFELNYDKFIVKEEVHHEYAEQVYEFINDDIGKKITFTVRTYNDDDDIEIHLAIQVPQRAYFSLLITNL